MKDRKFDLESFIMKNYIVVEYTLRGSNNIYLAAVRITDNNNIYGELLNKLSKFHGESVSVSIEEYKIMQGTDFNVL